MDKLKTSKIETKDNSSMFDIVIPVGPNDIDIINNNLEEILSQRNFTA